MKSKAVASILRHVASKVPSLNASGEVISPITESQDNKDAKRAARRARQAGKSGDAGAGGDDEGVLSAATAAVVVQDEQQQQQVPSGLNEEEKLEHLYETIAWPLGKIYGHPYDAFKLALTYVISLLPPPPPPFPPS